ncbi:condensation domain-containing protein, partial [Streptomyces sp. NRRL S-813]|uniref:condensation domain-containing protein n=1 Tax=Streptomyces sp. NRRL S-813 TaxID=1463919 RepID=UPI001F3CCCF5
LLAVQLVERLREHDLDCDVRTVFTTPTIAGLAAVLSDGAMRHRVAVPVNSITPQTEVITPDVLPLVSLDQTEIDRIVEAVPGGTANVQDIYPLAPLQEGILFHHLVSPDADSYVLSSLLTADSRERLDAFLAALQTVIDRHDILRTSLAWEGLSHPVQIVHRHTCVNVEELTLDTTGSAIDDPAAALMAQVDPRRYRMDLGQAPLIRLFTAHDPVNQRWLILVLMHHIIGDNASLQVLVSEVGSILRGDMAQLPPPVPYRNVVAQAVLGVPQAEHEAFFRTMLGDVAEPCAPYGLLDTVRMSSRRGRCWTPGSPAWCGRAPDDWASRRQACS